MSKIEYNLADYRFRQQWMLLGLPFDAVTLDQACDRVYQAIDSRTRCFISTPNLNFVINADKDPEFARSVWLSDLNLADGMPLVWAARWLKIPVPERVAGSTLFDSLVQRATEERPLRVFFFGGDPGVAERAADVLNSQPGHAYCCGYLEPGRGSVESMSSDAIIEQINASQADFLVVSLGAKKGQAWILHNLSRLDVPVVSHLGAVVNFVAGTVKRAPVVWQKLGLEWLWRIVEEPHLWRRYLGDGIAALRLAVGVFKARFHRAQISDSEVSIRHDTDTNLTIVLSGRPTAVALQGLYNELNLHLNGARTVNLHLVQADESQAEISAFIKVLEAVCHVAHKPFNLNRQKQPESSR
ncbi:WecB/TagA/CpsF family glycosyltransferase [Nitrincola sp.]|uniref:WecB/TagA/CpsF family glycosyltransferase n=1 Tax=Nitrincola sp. TaxID=1926584 RepID=UPI003A90D957